MNQWWGYIHTSGTLQTKRYFGPLDIEEAVQSPFCSKVFLPFEAKDREEAVKYIKEVLLKNENTNGITIE